MDCIACSMKSEWMEFVRVLVNVIRYQPTLVDFVSDIMSFHNLWSTLMTYDMSLFILQTY